MEILGYLVQGDGERGTDESELADSLGLTRGQVKYHLAVLCGAGLISPARDQKPGAADRFIAAASTSK